MSTVSDNRGALPPGAWDTHVHVFDTSIGPFAPARAYTPAQASLSQLVDFGRNLTQASEAPSFVIVQPSPYGTDNTVLLSTLRSLQALGLKGRGIAVVDVQTITDAELQEMHDLGVRGVRLNFQADGKSVDTVAFNKALEAAAERIAHMPGWMIQVFIPGYIWDDIFDTVVALPVPVIADHIGGLKGPSKLPEGANVDHSQQPGYQSLTELARRNKVIIKISALYRASTITDISHDDLAPLVRSLASEVPDQLVWASDWPHTGEGKDREANGIDKVEPFRHVDNETMLASLKGWIDSETIWAKMLVDNPARIYK
ncbi:unnamed protein product [Clonostachys rosea f. rosea IK726]|uniref:Amidohydrolase-related domain-containing protein n=2 Tax=Bionectria ochroleuca TaxID=29856 RepID=A0A0B7JJK0_BIOOC|nr:unnamed protein product [Clonostachys rosea f. rosea IK726]